VYGVKVVKSFRGESIDFARFEGKLNLIVKKPRHLKKLRTNFHGFCGQTE